MTDKELANYVLTHNLDEVIKICKEIIYTEEERLMTLNLRDSKLSNRAKTVLIRNNINTIGELLKVPKYELRKLPQLGWCTYNDILAAITKYGLELKEY